MATIAAATLAPVQFARVSSPRISLARPVSVKMVSGSGRGRMLVAFANPIDEKIEQSIKEAQETCAENPETGECAAAWDEVEELSAEASHQRDKAKGQTDPLEAFCKENPETDECRVYED